MVGQDGAVASLQKMVDNDKVPHTLLLTGPSGCGKTTIGRILKEILECGDADFTEINCADFKGIDMVRDIRRYANLAPMAGKCRIWLIDEAGKLTSDAQNAFLKLLEDTPKHVYFILATTDPQKLIKTIHTRSTEIKLAAMGLESLEKVIRRAVDREKMTLTDDVIQEIAEASDGSARKALVILEQVGGLATEAEQIQAIQTTSLNKADAFKLAQALFNWDRKTTWPDIAKLLRLLANDDPEGIRYVVLGYARSCMVGKDDRAHNTNGCDKGFKIIDIFGHNFYDSKAAGLAAACWEAFSK
jgi:DNA polymerase-3 subunit gamma/tau